jgi:hypothetical protein
MLTVITPAASNDLTTIAKVKAELGITGSGEDARLTQLVGEASALIAAYCGRSGFGRETLRQTERLAGYCEAIRLDRDLAPAITSVTVDGDALLPAEYEIDGSLLYRLSDTTRIAWTYGVVVIDYAAGWSLPSGAPADIDRATQDMVVGLYRASGRDPAVRQEMVEGIGSTSFFDARAGSGRLPIGADRLASIYRYRLEGAL